MAALGCQRLIAPAPGMKRLERVHQHQYHGFGHQRQQWHQRQLAQQRRLQVVASFSAASTGNAHGQWPAPQDGNQRCRLVFGEHSWFVLIWLGRLPIHSLNTLPAQGGQLLPVLVEGSLGCCLGIACGVVLGLAVLELLLCLRLLAPHTAQLPYAAGTGHV